MSIAGNRTLQGSHYWRYSTSSGNEKGVATVYGSIQAPEHDYGLEISHCMFGVRSKERLQGNIC